MNDLSVSILSVNFSRLGEEVELVERAGADFLHVDVMDGHFVPPISFGAIVIKDLIGKTSLPIDVHLMVENPEKYIDDYATPSTKFIAIHYEASIHLNRTVSYIRSKGIGAGVAINPSTPVSALQDILPYIDQVLVMSVNPGYSAQEFIDQSYRKINELASLREKNGYTFKISVDGGVSEKNAGEILQAGADMLVVGSAIFNSDSPEKWVRAFKEQYTK